MKFEDSHINNSEAVEKYIEKEKQFPKNKIIGTGTFILHNNILHLVTNAHVLTEVKFNLKIN